ncbi:L-glutamate gamma-semialdehyde dehydrogenase [Virgibacillus phasianinus]|uniref:1-pyrroline-5-carboxylate dehydrogenase n=1 Tax=Virgibacillus phasianinus TaxID=2017483 RepID=A0A220U523_9BACI|nr:L-glutamate gamma-semialdehyde dehydrogenase [Virgibacillus phasianinus]ASK63217.1 L-glutamate gamma-semialdehyde dehydrogenase [Virgibacillus phasianinus]
MVLPYTHEPFTDFTNEENRKAFEAALKQVESDFGKEYDLVIGGKRITTDKKNKSINPSNKEQVVGVVSQADQELVEKAFQSAKEAFKTWSRWDPKVRAEILFRAAAIVRRRKHEFSATMVYEAGKPWGQADADTAEGIDFMEYYGRHMIELAQGKPVNDRPGENNEYVYQPTGVGVTIPPWNFAFAIMCGTTVAPLVTGNTVLQKPAEDTPVVAAKLVEVLEEAGLPDGVLNFVPGDPSEIGDYLVDHPTTKFVNFTGSRATGTRIYEKAAKVQEGQKHLKHVVVEMGGKDTIIVDKNADLDLAADAIVNSAFGFQGQKCSACSRAVIHQDVYDEVLEKSIEFTKKLSVGNPVNDTYMGPVINQKQFDKIRDYIEIGQKEGKLKIGGEIDDTNGYFIQPTIFAGLDPEARIMQEEIFGPVVGFTKAKDFDEMLDIANNTDYGLTGAVISNNREHLNRARTEFDVGNLYFNRGCTAAIVGYHPFGGFKMSGTDAKAGGPDYLQNFLQAKTISEQL